MSLIQLNDITKEFKVARAKGSRQSGDRSKVLAVDHISISIREGELVGYIGPNGAGKSTTIKMMTGILVPTSGTISIGNYVPFKERKKYVKNIGVIFGQRSQLWWDLPVIDTFLLMKYTYKIGDSDYRTNLAALSEILDLDGLLNRPVRQLSLGQRMRCEIACALLHNPKLLFLDEPTIGLDVIAKEQVRLMIKRLNKEKNTTIVLTTHDMSDIEELCERIVIIDQGKIIYDDTLANIKKRYGNEKIMHLFFRNQPDLSILPTDATVIDHSDRKISISIHQNKTNMAELLQKLVVNNQIIDIELLSVPIETIIRDIYTKGMIL